MAKPRSALTPILPPYDALEWSLKPLPEKARMTCEAWALQGYGSPPAVFIFYALKMALYVGGWLVFCGFTPGMGKLAELDAWWLTPDAFQKAIVWSLLFEVLGLGCGSGPLTGRYLPPVGGFLYFLRPGTTKLPLFERAKLIGGHTRSLLDVALYAALLAACLAALIAAHPGYAELLPIAVLLPVLGVLDRTIFLCARGEHYWTTVMMLVLATSDFVPGAKGVHASLWFWAGISKLNHHFPNVTCVMTSNSPVLRFEWLRKRMYRDYPRDLNPSALAVWMSHAGTLLELTVPTVLLLGDGGTVTLVGLLLMLALHGFITSNVPMGVPLEWNVMMVYGGFFLFWHNAQASVLDAPPAALALLAIMGVLVPLAGNLWPARVPFLLAMRYYAGNWAYSVWLFKKGSHVKLEKLRKSTPWVFDQLGKLYDDTTVIALSGRVMAFRMMHLHGRALPDLVPRALAPAALESYDWIEGELMAGMALGWNFGDGHLHSEQLLRALQAQCGFEEGELRCVMVESQPLFGTSMHYRIHDARRGLLEQGDVEVGPLRARQPWQSAADASG
jgi:hypothetical protein